MEYIIGIDLGTTNSVVAVYSDQTSRCIPNKEGSMTTPSIVGFKKGKRVVGQSAKRQLQLYPQQTINVVKRFMGKRYEEAFSDMKLVNYTFKEDANGDCLIDINGRYYTPQEISGSILRYLKESAEEFLGQEIHRAVVTVPAYFNDRQRQATKDAGTLAGLDVIRVINEPTAAALAYSVQENKKSNTIAIYDFGGGTFDISILHIDGELAEVLSTHGNNSLGGKDVDQTLVQWIVASFYKEHKIDLTSDIIAMQRIQEEAERVKIELSSSKVAQINLPFIYSDENGPKNLLLSIEREQFEKLIADIVEQTIQCCSTAIELAQQKLQTYKTKIDEVVLVGGSSRIPLVQNQLKAFFQVPLNKSLNPDEVVALGAAIQGGSLAGTTTKAVTLLDVTPFSLGIETANDGFATIIRSNSQIPTTETRSVTTSVDNQRTIRIHVLQGEHSRASQNMSLGEFELTNIQPATAGSPKIEIKFSVNSNGMVEVSAFDKNSGERNEIVIQNNDGLSKQDVKEIKSRMDRNEEPEIQVSSVQEPTPKENILEENATKHPAQERLAALQKMINKHQAKLGSKSLNSLETFVSQAQKLLSDEKHSSKWDILQQRIDRVLEDVQKQVQA